MAIRYAVATGNWSNVAIWDGGASLPTVGDDVYANSYIVQIDQNITVTKISTEVCPTTSVGGGRFTPSASGRILTCNIVAGTSYCVHQSSGYTVTYIGNIYGGTVGSCYGINAQNLTVINIIGNIYGGSGGLCYGLYIYNIASGSITGSIYGGVTATDFGFFHELSSTAAISILGNIIAAGASGVRMSLNLNFTGNIYASSTANGILGTAVSVSTVANITGNLFNSNAKLAIGGYYNIYFSPSSSTAWTFYSSNDVAKPLYTADVLENPPAENDVRAGVVYGIGDAYEGTLETGSTPAEFVAALVASDLGLRMAKCAVTEEVLTMLENLE
jgi:hypothetical protein